MTFDELARSYLWKAKSRRKEREIAFYGDIDMIPTKIYQEGDATRAIADTDIVLVFASRIIPSTEE